MRHFLQQDLVKDSHRDFDNKKRLLSNLLYFVLISIVVVSFTNPSLAVTCNVTQSTPEFVEMNRGGTVFRQNTVDLRQGNDALRSVDMQNRLTNIIQFRQTRADLPIDDPDRMIDPGGPDAGTGTNGLGLGEKLYWCEADGTPAAGDSLLATHMCSNGDCLIDNVVFDRSSASYILTIRNAQDCFQNPDFPSC